MRRSAARIYVQFKIALAVSSLGLVACWDSGKGRTAPAQSAEVATRLVSEPSPDFPAVKLQVASIKVAAQADPRAALSDRDWHVLAQPGRSFDLGEGTAQGAGHELGAARELPRLRFSRCSLVLAPGPHTVRLADGTEAPLRIPAQLPKGIPVDLEGQPAARARYDLRLVLDLARSIQRSLDGDGRTLYTFRPHFRAVDPAATVAVTGRLVDAEGRGLGGQTLTAQIEGDPVRRTRTGPDGAYRLDLVPWPGTAHVVTQAMAGQGVFPVRASEPLNPAQRTDLIANLNLGAPATLPAGTLAGTIRLRVDGSMHDELEILQELPAGGPRFVVQGTLAVPAADGATSHYALALPPGQYQVRHSRVTLDAEGRPLRAVTPLRPATVTGGTATTVDF